ncbi:MAG: T9SS type A sorting domain-containing protein [Saprospiraceae bacterium]|nr:T9SS type A sorting domain-containing protein [Saprospiraceae bacterium]
MKKALLLFAFFAAFVGSAIAQIVVSGNITTNTTWTKNNTYLLQGFVYVKNGATLTIEAGTTIKGDKTTKGSLIVTRGAKLIADGTPSEPIVFTSNEANPTYGDWGGIILLGNGPTNAAFMGQQGVGQIEGGVDNAEGDGLYGGGTTPNPADNSGILRYVRIEYPGIAFQPNSEINGLTMGGVGSGTTIEYVQVSFCGDDSFEWFGGTVNCKYLIAYRGLDDDFDADFGYSGKVQFAVSVRDPQVADQSGSNGFEIDNDAQGSGATPKTRPTFSNVTVIGPTGSSISPQFARASHLRRNSEPGIYNSVFMGQYPVGLFIDGDSCAINAQTGKLVVKNSFYYGMTELLRKNTPTFDIEAWAAANQITTSSDVNGAQLVNPFNLALPNPRPGANSPVLNAASFSDTRIADFFFTPVSYAGAFGPSGDWTCPWAKWGQAGCLPSNQEVVVSGNITTNTTWTADKTYVLQGFVYVKNCATLTIQPGTLIKGDKGSKGALIVTRCSKINAEGTEGEPIVFTTNDPNPTYGSWGGLIILGNGTTNAAFNGQAGCGQIEGGVDNANGDGLYGGGCGGGTPNAADNSGILRYVRIEYPGIAFQPNSEINGLTLGGVGSGTTIDHIQVSYCGDDSYEWFGGSVNCKYLIAYRGLDDDFDADFGYNGDVQFALSVRDPQIADQSNSNGFEIDNDAQGSTATPKTRPTFSNVTIVGPTGTINPLYRRAAHLRRNSEPGIFNSLFVGSYPVGIFIDGNSCADNATNGLLEVKNTIVAGQVDLLTTNATNGFDIDSWYATAAFGNQSFTTNADAKLEDPFTLDFPNAQPVAGSPVLGNASFSAARINKPFFQQVDYIGAFSGLGAGSDWTCGWSKFLDLNISCFPGSVGTKDIAAYATDIKVYPTVTSDRATLELNLLNSTELVVDIYGLDGQYYGQQVNETAAAGQQTYTLNTGNLSGGFYFVRIQAGDAVTAEKLIVVR